MKPPFKIGDKVIRMSSDRHSQLQDNQNYTIKSIEFNKNFDDYWITLEEATNKVYEGYFAARYFKLSDTADEENERDKEFLKVARGENRLLEI